MSRDTDPAVASIRRWKDLTWNRDFLLDRQLIQATAFRIIAYFLLFSGHILVRVAIGCKMPRIRDGNKNFQQIKEDVGEKTKIDISSWSITIYTNCICSQQSYAIEAG